MNLKTLLLILAAGLPCAAQQEVRLEQLDLSAVKHLAPPMGYPAKAAQSVAGKPITIKGAVFEHGVGLHSGSTMVVDLHGQAEKFSAKAALDDARMPLPKPLPGSTVPNGLQNHPGTATVEIWLDGKRAADTGPLRRGTVPKPIAADLHGVKRMTIIVTDAGRWPYNNPVDLADAVITMQAGASSKPAAVKVPADPQPAIAARRCHASGHSRPARCGRLNRAAVSLSDSRDGRGHAAFRRFPSSRRTETRCADRDPHRGAGGARDHGGAP